MVVLALPTTGTAAADTPLIDPGLLPEPAAAAPSEPTEQRTRCAAVSEAPVTSVVPAAQRTLRFSDVWSLTRGAGQIIAVIDTGVAPHPLLPTLRAGGDYVSTGDGLEDCDAHGTVVAGLIAARPVPGSGFAGGAPDATILSIRQSSAAFAATSSEREADENGSTSAGYGDVESMAAAIRTAVDAGADVVNISEVACASAGSSMGDGALGAAVRYAAVDRDAVIVTAAGNLDGRRCRTQNDLIRGIDGRDTALPVTLASPAWFDEYVLTVGSLDPDGRPSSFSLNGPWVDVAAPGTEVTSLGATGTGLADGTLDDEGRRTAFTGTSFATPFVSATAALVRARHPELSAADVIDRIVTTAHSPAGDWDSAVGHGSLDPVAAVTGSAVARGEDASVRLSPRTTPPVTDRRDALLALASSVGILLLVSGALAVRAVVRRQDPS
ncbi:MULTISPECIES: type VII secretion-associated serine protease mycosin [unclassified Rhodococcus (in: high G+C Gram-positive bacteria)]|uniref:type VII secretion-associated serine protease mycosin n=1 Tax=unclassified Rhodococcus (in: high G+C Gram-positive bacteria) TaxID=192944 RepID=UPI0006FA7FB9|nr:MULTISPECIES: type VII secretion-associated serine protease mycosin [unclassified Rhodococcus (in: high G+C Gram-positive bacteria)]KQU35597.1 hypothetical protein ASG69_20655 [Rhodococcus sp. Leaf225]KQU47995.1 hypothetical protein ASH03_20860 [Rhodococcus sp. Leaf258]